MQGRIRPRRRIEPADFDEFRKPTLSLAERVVENVRFAHHGSSFCFLKRVENRPSLACAGALPNRDSSPNLVDLSFSTRMGGGPI